MTLAQLGIPETYCPAKHRFPTRMFPAEKPGEYEPHRIRKVVSTNGSGPAPAPTSAPSASAPEQPPKDDVEMKDAGASAAPAAPPAGEETSEGAEKPATEPVPEVIYEEDVTSDEGAVYPIQNGRIVNRNALFALFQHIYNLLSPPLHTPILIVSEPAWTPIDRDEITRFVFEHFNTPAFSFVDAAFSAAWGYGVKDAVVVDVGKSKADVTAIIDYRIQDHGRGIALQGCGGDAMTDRLFELLGPKGFSREMCEQLKRSDIAEILPPGTHLPGAAATARQSNPSDPPAADSSNGDSAPTEGSTENNGEEEGVLDVAAIVSGNTSEYLANMEKDKSVAKKAGAADPKLPNAQKERATFQFEEFVEMEDEAQAGGPKRYKRNIREIPVGIERFLAATPRQKAGPLLSNGILEDLAAQIHYTINSCHASKRSDLWNSLIIVGAGTRVRGRFPPEFTYIPSLISGHLLIT